MQSINRSESRFASFGIAAALAGLILTEISAFSPAKSASATGL
jgi:hypothetical protein